MMVGLIAPERLSFLNIWAKENTWSGYIAGLGDFNVYLDPHIKDYFWDTVGYKDAAILQCEIFIVILRIIYWLKHMKEPAWACKSRNDEPKSQSDSAYE